MHNALNSIASTTHTHKIISHNKSTLSVIPPCIYLLIYFVHPKGVEGVSGERTVPKTGSHLLREKYSLTFFFFYFSELFSCYFIIQFQRPHISGNYFFQMVS